ncbi:MAG: hypothetical protein AABY53_09630 [Bdellovibrionota bacterium]
MKKHSFVFILLLLTNVLLSNQVQANEKNKIQRCALESCHGLDLKCSFNAPEICSQMYAIGDFCRQYAQCEISGDSCSLTKNPVLDKCLSCMKNCPTKDPIKHSVCEAKCREKLEVKLKN